MPKEFLDQELIGLAVAVEGVALQGFATWLSWTQDLSHIERFEVCCVAVQKKAEFRASGSNICALRVQGPSKFGLRVDEIGSPPGG